MAVAGVYLSRSAKMFVKLGSNIWELPILEGYSLSQSSNTSEVTLNEAAGSGGASRRGRRIFNDSLAPAEFSFSTYVRPFQSTGTGTGKASTTDNETHAVEEVLWAMMAGADTYTANNAYPFSKGSASNSTNVVTPTGATKTSINWGQSNVVQLGTGFSIIFQIEEQDSDAGFLTYTIDGAVINEATIDFDIEGIATINWSGMGTAIAEAAAEIDPTIYEGTTATNNFIQNKISTCAINSSGSDFTGMLDAYNVTLTGGSITISNNISFLTPAELDKINKPIGHVTGTRSISGNFTCYLDGTSAGSADLFEDLSTSLTSGTTSAITNSMALTFALGGASAPKLSVILPTCNVQVPTHSFDDVISVDVAFDALGSNLENADELTLEYVGPA